MNRALYNACVLLVLSALALRADAKTIGLLMGPIRGGSLGALVAGVNSLSSGDQMDMYIDSGGGEVEEARHLMAAIDHALVRGATLRCFVLGEAESAAFWVLLHCSERYALPQSMLMFHHIRIPQVADVTVRDAARMQQELAQLDSDYLDDLQRRVPGVSRARLEALLDREAQWTSVAIAKALPGVLTAVFPVYPGLIEMLRALPAPVPQPPQEDNK